MSEQLVRTDHGRQQPSSTPEDDNGDILAFRIMQVREDAELLLRSIALEAVDTTIIIATRLRRSLADVERTAFGRALSNLEYYDEIVSHTVQLQDEVYRLLELVPRAPQDQVLIRRHLARLGATCLSRYRRTPGDAVNAPNESLSNLFLESANLQHSRLHGATLRNVIAREANMSRMFAPDVALLHVDLWGSNMNGATLDRCRAEDSCLATATMAYAAMFGATVMRCDLRGAVLREASLEHAVFISCDLRGATLEASRIDAGTRAAQFIRCDLRGTSWGTRDLAGVKFEDCKMAGLRGRPRTAGIVVVRPDLSSAGDGSAHTMPAAPEALWDGAP